MPHDGMVGDSSTVGEGVLETPADLVAALPRSEPRPPIVAP